METHTRQLLAEYAELINEFGPDSDEAMIFLESNDDNSEFAELAKLSRTLKKALTSPHFTDSTSRPHYQM